MREIHDTYSLDTPGLWDVGPCVDGGLVKRRARGPGFFGVSVHAPPTTISRRRKCDERSLDDGYHHETKSGIDGILSPPDYAVLCPTDRPRGVQLRGTIEPVPSD